MEDGARGQRRGWFHAAATSLSLSLSLDSSRGECENQRIKVSSLGVSGRRGRHWSSRGCGIASSRKRGAGMMMMMISVLVPATVQTRSMADRTSGLSLMITSSIRL